MKRCSYCGAEYPDDAAMCAIDHTSLESSKRAPALSVNHSPQKSKPSLGRPFWIGCVIGPILFLIVSLIWEPHDSFLFRMDIGIAVIVFGPVGGAVAQVGHDVAAARRLRLLHMWDFLVFTAIVITLVVAGEALFHGNESDIDMFNNRTFDIAVAFIGLTILVYAVSKNFAHFISRYTWIVIFSTVALLAACIGIYRVTGFDLTWVLVIGTALWATMDSAKIHLKDYESGIAYGPAVLFFGFLLLWVVVFPWYLLVRHRIKAGEAVLKDSVAGGSCG